MVVVFSLVGRRTYGDVIARKGHPMAVFLTRNRLKGSAENSLLADFGEMDINR